MAEWFIAIIIGIVEGVTEFLPISSTGHMIIVGNLIGFNGEKATSFEIFIQLGAILAVVFLYFKRFVGLLNFSKKEDGFTGFAGLLKIALACLPACVLGALFHKKIKTFLFNPANVATSLILGGVILMLIERTGKEHEVNKLENISFKEAFLIGMAQCFALIPGVSRSGSMIVGGIYLGINRIVAAEFSFLVAVPIMILATSKELYDSYQTLNSSDIDFFMLGFATSFLTALMAIRFFIGLLKKFSLAGFGVYRIIIGILTIKLLN